jgi:2,3-bisphosphoglycerate-dependent phosphoglycerate mutase
LSTNLFLVRHAHSVWTRDETRPLSDKGRIGAHKVTEVLRSFPISRIFSSPSARAQQSVTPLAKQLGIVIQPEADLRERNLGNWVKGGFEDAVKTTWDDASFAHPGGESNSSAQERGVAVVNKIVSMYPDETTVLATHGNLLALILQHFDPSVGFEFWQTLTMPDIYRLDISTGSSVSVERVWSDETNIGGT